MALVLGLGATAVIAAPFSEPPDLKACFNNHGVEFGTFNAWLCAHKEGNDPSGSFYFALSVDNGLNDANPSGQMMWSKLHAAPNAYYVWENYSEPWGGSTPRANGRIIGIDEGPAGQCIIQWPDWTVDPTTCSLVTNGGAVIQPPHTLNATEEYSVDEYQLNARATLPLSYR